MVLCGGGVQLILYRGGDLSSPVQLGSATDWKDARCVGNFGLEDNAYVMIRES